MKKLFSGKSKAKIDESTEAIPSSSSFASFDAALSAEIDQTEQTEENDNEAGPDPAKAAVKLNPRLLLSLLLLMVLGGAVWAFSLGPLRPTLNGAISSAGGLFNRPSATPTLSPTPLPPTPTRTPFPPTYTPEFSPTPTDTPTPEASPTLAETPTPTSAVSGCLPADSITLEDVGKTLCVTGNVFKTNEKPSVFTIVVGSRPDSFFFVSYDRTWNLEKGRCIYATGEIVRLGNNPIMLISYNPALEYCTP